MSSSKQTSKKSFSVIRYKEYNDKKCFNDTSEFTDDENKDFIIYEDVYLGKARLWCFKFSEVDKLLTTKINPFTSRPFSEKFIIQLRNKFNIPEGPGGNLIIPSEKKKHCTKCSGGFNTSCKSKIILSDASIKFIDFYVGKTYMVDMRYLSIPEEISQELSLIKRCMDYSNNLYRGVGFSLTNIPYFISYLKQDINKEFKEEYIKPVSTTINYKVAANFAKKSIYGIIIKFTRIKSNDILIDLNLLSQKNKKVLASKDIISDENEVILIPNSYRQKIEQIFGNKSFMQIERLNRLYKIFEKDIEKVGKEYFYKDYFIIKNDSFSFKDINMSKPVELNFNSIELEINYNIEKKFPNYDDMLDYIENNKDTIFQSSLHKLLSDNNISQYTKEMKQIITITDENEVKYKLTKLLSEEIIKRPTELKNIKKLQEVIEHIINKINKISIPGKYNPQLWLPNIKKKYEDITEKEEKIYIQPAFYTKYELKENLDVIENLYNKLLSDNKIQQYTKNMKQLIKDTNDKEEKYKLIKLLFDEIIKRSNKLYMIKSLQDDVETLMNEIKNESIPGKYNPQLWLPDIKKIYKEITKNIPKDYDYEEEDDIDIKIDDYNIFDSDIDSDIGSDIDIGSDNDIGSNIDIGSDIDIDSDIDDEEEHVYTKYGLKENLDVLDELHEELLDDDKIQPYTKGMIKLISNTNDKEEKYKLIKLLLDEIIKRPNKLKKLKNIQKSVENLFNEINNESIPGEYNPQLWLPDIKKKYENIIKEK